jgi:pimeloyl-ACP methyl ester carboxylesterase
VRRSRSFTLPASGFEVRTDDGVRLRGHRLGVGPVALVFAHGFLGWHRKPKLVAFQEALARWFTVYGFDLRGHGASGGESSFGTYEFLDVDAVVRRARSDGFERVATVGGSMGGIAVIRQAALRGGVDAVVSASAPARWLGHRSDAVRRLAVLTSSGAGRAALRLAGARVAHPWPGAEDPVDLVGRIAPAPFVVVHGVDDHYFDVEQAWMLYRAANDPKRLLIAPRFGHAEDGYTAAFAERLHRTLDPLLAAEPHPLPRGAAP